MTPETHDLWLALAELFFLDTESQEGDYRRVAALLRQADWDRERTYRELVEHITPNAASNLGHGIYPAIGEWAGFDKTALCTKIERSSALRERYPNWYFWLQDRHSRWMLKQLKVERLLTLLD